MLAEIKRDMAPLREVRYKLDLDGRLPGTLTAPNLCLALENLNEQIEGAA